jgi:hypothetical protein
MMKATSTSETSTRLHGANIPDDSHLHTRRRDNLKSHQEERSEKFRTLEASQSQPSVVSQSQPSAVSQLVEAYARDERLAGHSWLTMHFI